MSHQIQIPLLPISEKTRMDELQGTFLYSLNYLHEKFGQAPPVLLFEPLSEVNLSSSQPTLSKTPENLLVASIFPSVTESIFQALKTVEAKEPPYPSDQKRKAIKLKENTPLKNLFRQMAEMPLTVFSVTVPAEAESVSIFFLRTAFTIGEFQKEIQRIIISDDSDSTPLN